MDADLALWQHFCWKFLDIEPPAARRVWRALERYPGAQATVFVWKRLYRGDLPPAAYAALHGPLCPQKIVPLVDQMIEAGVLKWSDGNEFTEAILVQTSPEGDWLC